MRSLMILSSILTLGACNMADAQDRDKESHRSGEQGQRSFDLAGFNFIALGGSHDVVVTVGGAHSVRAEGDAEALERLEIKVEKGKLVIGSKRGDWSFGRREHGKVTVHVTLPALAGAAIGGSGDMRIDKVEGGDFTGAIGGSGDMSIASLKVNELKFAIAGSGGISATGSAAKADMSIAGSGDIDAGALESRTASISIVGSGDVRARAVETADVSVMGSGNVSMAGPAKCKISKMGSGNVECEG
jgi:hypothetical protein